MIEDYPVALLGHFSLVERREMPRRNLREERPDRLLKHLRNSSPPCFKHKSIRITQVSTQVTLPKNQPFRVCVQPSIPKATPHFNHFPQAGPMCYSQHLYFSETYASQREQILDVSTVL
jgi:hypothetical protein